MDAGKGSPGEADAGPAGADFRLHAGAGRECACAPRGGGAVDFRSQSAPRAESWITLVRRRRLWGVSLRAPSAGRPGAGRPAGRGQFGALHGAGCLLQRGLLDLSPGWARAYCFLAYLPGCYREPPLPAAPAARVLPGGAETCCMHWGCRRRLLGGHRRAPSAFWPSADRK